MIAGATTTSMKLVLIPLIVPARVTRLLLSCCAVDVDSCVDMEIIYR